MPLQAIFEGPLENPETPIRGAVRFPLKIEAVLHAHEGDLPAVTVNISTMGVIFALDQAIRVGQELEFTMFLSTGGQVHCKGQIIRCEAKKWRFEAAATIKDYLLGTQDMLFL